MVYLIHLERPLAHARHYIGYAKDDWNLWLRLQHHRGGNGSRFLKAVVHADIPFYIVRIWENGSQDFERKLKRRGSAKRICPLCRENVNVYRPLASNTADQRGMVYPAFLEYD